ncbi:MAG TPA: BamA/TamA family outer membrane protein, partial [Ferruginibacter sp.]|nr:BamA/TamA family outer membrane protein [Ferruginibacter sp.]
SPYYSRVFNNIETKEVRIYGIAGKDEFKVSGTVNKSIKLRLIGGPGEDKYEDLSSIKKNGKRTIIYDNYQNEIIKSGETKLHLSNDSSIHAYEYDTYKPNKKSFKPGIFYSNEDRIFISYTWLYQKQQWRKSPYGFEHKMDVKYSLGQKAFSSTYASRFIALIGKWDVNLFANYDQVRWTNFYGIGNETKLTTKDRDYNRLRSRQFLAKAGVQRVINNRHKFIFNPYYQTFDIINDTARFLAKNPALVVPQTYNTHQFAGAEIVYIYQNLNDSVLPTKGFSLSGAANFSQNIKESKRKLGKFSAELNSFLPLPNKLSIKIKTGATTLSGQPEFYQLNTVGSTETLRGHQRDRFYGKTTVYNQNELRWITDVRSYRYNGKIGLFALYDLGRVWMDNEKSNKWHTGYGGGIMLSPFNKISVTAAYAISEEDNNFHFQLIKVL